jgi:hypothetical protein
MIRRLATRRIRELLRQYPAVALVGPRQAGKTTLARGLSAAYYDLEQESERLRLDVEWQEVEAAGHVVVLDEAQAYPEVFPRLRGAIDARRRRRGRFLILGSVSPRLMRQVSESLAGRLALCELTPLLLPEIGTRRLDDLWLRGGYPDGGILDAARFPDWQRHYARLLAERDLPNWGLPAQPQLTGRLLRMLAACQGVVLNASELGRSLALSYHTVGSYLDYLEGAFLVRRLPPFVGNVRKRLVRSPRLYWRDSGLLHALLGVPDREALLAQPWVGAGWEGFVIDQILGLLATAGVDADPCFVRTSDGYEVDLVLSLDGARWALEIKLTSSPGPGDLERLARVSDMVGAERRVLISRTVRTATSRDTLSTNLAGFLDLLRRTVLPGAQS